MSVLSKFAVLGLLTLGSFAPSGTPSPSVPAAQDRSEVLVLGTFHMSNPGRDVFNTDAGDVLTPRRQSEIAEVVDLLARFQPTVVAVEADVSSPRTAERYAAYRVGEHELSRSETEQLGFRLAAQLGLETVHAVDVEAEFPFPRLDKYVTATGQRAALEAMMERTAEQVEAQSAYLATHTILETLLRINDDERVLNELGIYFRLAEFGEPDDWAGADLVAAWFRRNMRIYTNIAGLVESPNDRVLVIYGSGHLGWLQDAFDRNPRFRLRRLAEFAP
jgi:hypothetical protein